MLRNIPWNLLLNFRSVFFEKKRIAEGKEKTDLRIRQEKAFPGGRDKRLLKSNSLWLREDETTHFDELGRIVVTSSGGNSRCFA